MRVGTQDLSVNGIKIANGMRTYQRYTCEDHNLSSLLLGNGRLLRAASDSALLH